MGFRRQANLTSILAVGVLLAGSASGAITIDGGPAGGPIGGGGYSGGSGNIGTAGGLTWNYSGLDLSASEHLYYGLHDSALSGLSLNGSGFTANEIFGSGGAVQTAANQYEWRATSVLLDYVGGSLHSHTVQTRLVMTISGSGNWIADPTLNTAGVAYPNALWEVTGGTGFSVNLRVEFRNPHAGNTYQPYLDAYNSLPTQGGVYPQVSVSPAWYWEDTVAEAVPEPASMATFAGLGLCLAAGAWRRRRKQLV